MKTMTIRKGGGSNLAPGWKTLTVTNAKYGTWEGKRYLDIWFEDLPESCNGRIYEAIGKDGEEFSIAQVFRFANAGLGEVLTNATGDATVQYDDSAENLIGQSLNVFMHKDGEYSRILKQFAPTEFENAVEKFTDSDVLYWKGRAEKYYNDYVKKDTSSNGFVEEMSMEELTDKVKSTQTDSTESKTTDDVAGMPF